MTTANATDSAEEDELIEVPRSVDVLCGRGKQRQQHPGNQAYLGCIYQYKLDYDAALKGLKVKVVERVVNHITNDIGGRFLASVSYQGGSAWKKISRDKAIVKTSQAFRDLPKNRVFAGSEAANPAASAVAPPGAVVGDSTNNKRQRVPAQSASDKRRKHSSNDSSASNSNSNSNSISVTSNSSASISARNSATSSSSNNNNNNNNNNSNEENTAMSEPPSASTAVPSTAPVSDNETNLSPYIPANVLPPTPADLVALQHMARQNLSIYHLQQLQQQHQHLSLYYQLVSLPAFNTTVHTANLAQSMLPPPLHMSEAQLNGQMLGVPVGPLFAGGLYSNTSFLQQAIGRQHLASAFAEPTPSTRESPALCHTLPTSSIASTAIASHCDRSSENDNDVDSNRVSRRRGRHGNHVNDKDQTHSKDRSKRKDASDTETEAGFSVDASRASVHVHS